MTGSPQSGDWLLRARALTAVPLLLAGAAFLQPIPARAGDDETPRLREKVSIDLITIPVRVEDAQGNFIRGLTAGDFEIREDGKSRRITNFSAPAEPGEAAAGEGGAGQRRREPTGELSYLIIYVDSQNLSPLRRGLAIDRLRDLAVEGAHPPVPVMIVNSGIDLEVIQKMTSDWSLIDGALETLRDRPVGGTFDATARKSQLDTIQRSVRRTIDCYGSRDCGGGATGNVLRSTLNEIRNYARGVGAESLSAVDRIASICNYVAHLRGRKALVYVSDGFPMQPGGEIYEDLRLRLRSAVASGFSEEAGVSGTGGGLNQLLSMVNQAELESLSGDLSSGLEKATGIANGDGVSIYTLRLEAPSSGVIGPEISGRDERNSVSILTSGRADQNLTAPLSYLADTTGGSYMRGEVRIGEALDRVVADSEERYLLGFTSPLSDDGNYHKLKVTVRGRKAVIRHPSGYLGRSPAMRRADLVLAQLSHGLGENPYAIALELGPGARDSKKKPVIKTRVLVPIRSMPLVRTGAAWEGKLKLFVLIVDKGGKTQSAREFEVPVSIPDEAIEAARGQLFPISFDAPATDGENRFGIGLWDEDYIDGSFTRGTFNYEE